MLGRLRLIAHSPARLYFRIEVPARSPVDSLQSQAGEGGRAGLFTTRRDYLQPEGIIHNQEKNEQTPDGTIHNQPLDKHTTKPQE